MWRGLSSCYKICGTYYFTHDWILQVERARRAIRVFVLMRRLSLMISGESDTQLPLVSDQQCIRVSDVLDLSTLISSSKGKTYSLALIFLKDNADLIACTVVMRDGSRMRRFLVIDPIQLILVEPDARRLGWGVAKFVGFLQVN
jgi:protein CLEC16A